VKGKARECDKSRSSGKGGLEAQDRGKLKEAHLNNNNRKIRKYSKMDVHKGNIQNNANEHETSKSEREIKRKMQNLFST
jgi:hypothetical protein